MNRPSNVRGVRQCEYDVVVVGAGPAGLAAAAACCDHGLSVLVLERGPALDQRNRNQQDHIAAGVGGAGLFSDGKFSFYPSATRLWALSPSYQLQEAYGWFCSLVEKHGLSCPAFPLVNSSSDCFENSRMAGAFVSKAYDSTYMPLEFRHRLINFMSKTPIYPLETMSGISSLTFSPDIVVVNTMGGSAEDATTTPQITARALILATGRLGPLFMQKHFPQSLLRFRRLEIGVRIEQSADQFFLQDAPTLDPKLISKSGTPDVQWRTFCCCRNGEVVTIRFDDLLAVSGRADGQPTGRSNVGFHVRITNPSLAELAWRLFYDRARLLREPITESLRDFLQNTPRNSSPLHQLFGEELSQHLDEGIRSLSSYIGADKLGESLLHGPAIEGVLLYPIVDDGLRLSKIPVWVAGDATGLFRGLTAAIVSGYFAGLQVTQHIGVGHEPM